MRKFLEIFIFSAIAITVLALIMFTKDYLYTHNILSVSSSVLGVDGLIVWFCLMMGIRQFFKSITTIEKT
jgi:hypothetical protein